MGSDESESPDFMRGFPPLSPHGGGQFAHLSVSLLFCEMDTAHYLGECWWDLEILCTQCLARSRCSTTQVNIQLS